MGMLDELDATLAATGDYVNSVDKDVRWVEICVCGHEKAMHGQNNGGEYGGVEWARWVDGCAGPPQERNAPKQRRQADGMAHMPPTCPCTIFRPVAEVDRPGRYFRQKTWTRDRIHPMLRGLQAQRTRLSRSKTYAAFADEEIERRFKWIDGKRKCRVCGKQDGSVWPSYVNEQRLSQMRCAEHRELPLAEAP